MNTAIVITEDVSATMAEAMSGPKFAADYDQATASDAELERVEAAQAAGEADYAARWIQAAGRIAAERGYDAQILLTSEHHRGTRTVAVDGDTVEREIWQAAHDATDLPEGW